jgi:hypothetical protein
MTIEITAINTATDSFGQWIEKTNQVLDALSNKIVTTNSNTAIGNSAISGKASSNGVYANSFIIIGSTTANTKLSDNKVIVYENSTSNTSITSNGMIINGSVLYKSNIMQIGSSVIRNANITSQIGTFTTRVVSGNSVMYPTYIQADAVNTYSFSLEELSIGDIEANVQFDRNGFTITSNPTGDYQEQSSMSSTDLYVNEIHCSNLTSTGTATLNNLTVTGNFALNPAGGSSDLKFTSNVLFYGQKNFFAKGLTSNGNVGIGIGLGKDFNAAAPLHLVRAGTATGSMMTYNSKSAMIVESNENNLIEFRTPPDSGKYAGMVWNDNNQGAYLVYQTGPLGGDRAWNLRLGAEGAVNLEVGDSGAISDGIQSRNVVFQAARDSIRVWTPDGITLYGKTSGYAQIVSHPTSSATKFTLPINGGNNGQTMATDGSGNLYWRNVSHIVPETDLRINSLGVACAPGASGTIRAAQDITAFIASDSSLKTNVKNIDNALEKIQSINGVEFDWTDEYIEEQGGEDGYFIRKHDVGVIAQEIESVLPEVVATRENGIKAVKYDRIVALLIEGIKELKAEVEDLKKNTCKCGCK